MRSTPEQTSADPVLRSTPRFSLIWKSLLLATVTLGCTYSYLGYLGYSNLKQQNERHLQEQMQHYDQALDALMVVEVLDDGVENVLGNVRLAIRSYKRAIRIEDDCGVEILLINRLLEDAASHQDDAVLPGPWASAADGPGDLAGYWTPKLASR